MVSPQEYFLRDWTVQVHGKGQVTVEGITNGLSDGKAWRSSLIKERIDRSSVRSYRGSVYHLIGPMNQTLARLNGVPEHVILSLSRGFPENWKTCVSKSEQKSPRGGLSTLSRKQGNDHSSFVEKQLQNQTETVNPEITSSVYSKCIVRGNEGFLHPGKMLPPKDRKTSARGLAGSPLPSQRETCAASQKGATTRREPKDASPTSSNTDLEQSKVIVKSCKKRFRKSGGNSEQCTQTISSFLESKVLGGGEVRNDVTTYQKDKTTVPCDIPPDPKSNHANDKLLGIAKEVTVQTQKGVSRKGVAVQNKKAAKDERLRNKEMAKEENLKQVFTPRRTRSKMPSAVVDSQVNSLPCASSSSFAPHNQHPIASDRSSSNHLQHCPRVAKQDETSGKVKGGLNTSLRSSKYPLVQLTRLEPKDASLKKCQRNVYNSERKIKQQLTFNSNTKIVSVQEPLTGTNQVQSGSHKGKENRLTILRPKPDSQSEEDNQKKSVSRVRLSKNKVENADTDSSKKPVCSKTSHNRRRKRERQKSVENVPLVDSQNSEKGLGKVQSPAQSSRGGKKARVEVSSVTPKSRTSTKARVTQKAVKMSKNLTSHREVQPSVPAAKKLERTPNFVFGGKGTMKRRRQLRDLLAKRNIDAEEKNDEFFPTTGINVATALQDIQACPNVSLSSCTTPKMTLGGPEMFFMQASVKRLCQTPANKLFVHDQKEDDKYAYNLEKWKKAAGRDKNNRAKSEKIKTPRPQPRKVNSKQLLGALEALNNMNKKCTSDMDSSDGDQYFSDPDNDNEEEILPLKETLPQIYSKLSC